MEGTGGEGKGRFGRGRVGIGIHSASVNPPPRPVRWILHYNDCHAVTAQLMLWDKLPFLRIEWVPITVRH